MVVWLHLLFNFVLLIMHWVEYIDIYGNIIFNVLLYLTFDHNLNLWTPAWPHHLLMREKNSQLIVARGYIVQRFEGV